MNSLISYYNSQIENPKSSDDLVVKAKDKRKSIILKIDELIDGLQHSEAE